MILLKKFCMQFKARMKLAKYGKFKSSKFTPTFKHETQRENLINYGFLHSENSSCIYRRIMSRYSSRSREISIDYKLSRSLLFKILRQIFVPWTPQKKKPDLYMTAKTTQLLPLCVLRLCNFVCKIACSCWNRWSSKRRREIIDGCK